MNADERGFKHQAITKRIIRAFFDVYNELGFGFLESVYREAMALVLEDDGLQVEKEFGLAARFRGRVIGGFKADLLVNGCVIVELKAVRVLDRSHEAQTLNYLRAGVLEVALLLNFGPLPQIRRLAYSNTRKVRPFLDAAQEATHLPSKCDRVTLSYPRSSALICGS
jgi:GxxExxY protein